MTRRILWIGGGVVGLALVVLLAFSIASEPAVDDSVGFGEVSVDGDPVPTHSGAPAADPALGRAAPTVSGHDWDENGFTIGPDGRPKVLIFLAHWCPHCQVEVPVIVDWIESGGVPDGVDLYSLTVSNDRRLPNWPPQDWLEGEGWPVPVIMDDRIGTAAVAFGMTGTPFYVVLDGDNGILGRFSGEVGVAGLDALVEIAQGS